MQTSTVILILVGLCVISYLLGHRRSYVVSADSGGVAMMHSLPRHYGYMAALWAGLPALLLLVLWIGFESRVISSMVAADLPPGVQGMPESEFGLYYNQVVSYAKGSIDGSQLDEAQLAAAGWHFPRRIVPPPGKASPGLRS